VEFLLVAVILAVGLLGLGGLQVAAVRGGAASRSQMVALALAGDALETAAFEAAGAGRGRPGWPGQPRYTGPDTRWISQHDRDGRPVRSSGPGGFSLVLTRTEAMASPEPMERRAAGARAAAGVFRARVTWVEAAPVAPAPGAAAGPGWRERRLALVRLIAF
jgi:Tfp pilus assembly protein PilV